MTPDYLVLGVYHGAERIDEADLQAHVVSALGALKQEGVILYNKVRYMWKGQEEGFRGLRDKGDMSAVISDKAVDANMRSHSSTVAVTCC